MAMLVSLRKWSQVDLDAEVRQRDWPMRFGILSGSIEDLVRSFYLLKEGEGHIAAELYDDNWMLIDRFDPTIGKIAEFVSITSITLADIERMVGAATLGTDLKRVFQSRG